MIAVLNLKSELETKGVSAIIQNDYKAGLTAGFGGGSQSTVDLYILESDIEKAKSVIDEFIQKNKD